MLFSVAVVLKLVDYQRNLKRAIPLNRRGKKSDGSNSTAAIVVLLRPMDFERNLGAALPNIRMCGFYSLLREPIHCSKHFLSLIMIHSQVYKCKPEMGCKLR